MKKNKILLSVSFLIIIANFMVWDVKFSYADEKPLKNYYCSKCGTHIESINQPMMGNCSSGGGHSWRCLGEVGDRRYQCSKCGLVVKSKDTPYGNVPCKNGGGHNWKRIS